MMPLGLADTSYVTAIDARVLLLPLLLGAGLYLILTSLPFGRPKRDLGGAIPPVGC